MKEKTINLSWVLLASTLAFFLLVLHQSVVIYYHASNFEEILQNIGLELPSITEFVLSNYLLFVLLLPLLSFLATTYIAINKNSSKPLLKPAYYFSITVLVFTFTWSGIVNYALFKPLFSMGSVI